jgi:hypothetical protein
MIPLHAMTSCPECGSYVVCEGHGLEMRLPDEEPHPAHCIIRIRAHPEAAREGSGRRPRRSWWRIVPMLMPPGLTWIKSPSADGLLAPHRWNSIAP